MDKHKLTVNRTIFYNDASGYYSRDRYGNITIYANADEWHIHRGAYFARLLYRHALTLPDPNRRSGIPDAYVYRVTDSDRETDERAD
jgi:hypothetical protein